MPFLKGYLNEMKIVFYLFLVEYIIVITQGIALFSTATLQLLSFSTPYGIFPKLRSQ